MKQAFRNPKGLVFYDPPRRLLPPAKPARCVELELTKADDDPTPPSDAPKRPKKAVAVAADAPLDAEEEMALRRWALDGPPPPSPDLSRWAAQQDVPAAASGVWASHGRSTILADAISRLHGCEPDRPPPAAAGGGGGAAAPPAKRSRGGGGGGGSRQDGALVARVVALARGGRTLAEIDTALNLEGFTNTRGKLSLIHI